MPAPQYCLIGVAGGDDGVAGLQACVDPDNRILIKVTMEDAQKADEIFNILMGDQVEPRREFIEKNAKTVKNLDV